MKNLKNRVLSTAMAGAIALSLAVPAFAADEAKKNETTITGTYKEQVIAVTVPQTGAAIINPLGLDIPIVDGDDSVAIKGQQIVTKPLCVSNQSAMNLSVGATVTGELKSGSTMKFATASTKASGSGDSAVAAKTDKSAFVYFQMKQTTLADPTDTDALNLEFSKWGASDCDAEKDIIVKAGEVTKDEMATLKPANDGETVAGGVALFRLTGDCGSGTKKGTDGSADPWDAAKDGFTVKVAFTFTPVAPTK